MGSDNIGSICDMGVDSMDNVKWWKDKKYMEKVQKYYTRSAIEGEGRYPDPHRFAQRLAKGECQVAEGLLSQEEYRALLPKVAKQCGIKLSQEDLDRHCRVAAEKRAARLQYKPGQELLPHGIDTKIRKILSDA